MPDRQTAAEYEQDAIRLAQAALDSASYDTPEQRTRKATLSQTYATLALMATIREGREPEIKEPVPEKEPIRVVTPDGTLTLFPIPQGGSDAPVEACMLRAPHPSHLWFRGDGQGGTTARLCEGRPHITDVHGLLPKQCPNVTEHREHAWLTEAAGFTYRCPGVGTEAGRDG